MHMQSCHCCFSSAGDMQKVARESSYCGKGNVLLSIKVPRGFRVISPLRVLVSVMFDTYVK